MKSGLLGQKVVCGIQLGPPIADSATLYVEGTVQALNLAESREFLKKWTETIEQLEILESKKI